MSMWVVAHTVAVAVYCFSLCVAVFFARTAIVHRETLVTILIESFVHSVTPIR